MSDLEIMQRGIDFTTEKFFKTNNNDPRYAAMSEAELQYQGVVYSAMILENVFNGTDVNGKNVFGAYTRQENLRGDMASLSKESIKQELLKNIVNVAAWHKANDTRAGNTIGDRLAPDMTDDEMSVVLFNIMQRYGVEKGYELLNSPQVLSSACRTFAWYRRSHDLTEFKGLINDGYGNLSEFYGENDIRQQLDTLAVSYEPAVNMNHELDVHHARYGNKPQGLDTSNLESYGYDANGGYSGFGRR